MNNLGGDGIPLWDEKDEFFYDVLSVPLSRVQSPRAVAGGRDSAVCGDDDRAEFDGAVPQFKERLEWFLKYRPELASTWPAGN